jgi:hypothetical protein
MRRKQLLGYSLLGVVVAFVGLNVANAQSDPAGTAAPATGKAAPVNIADQQKQAEQYVSRMESIVGGVQRDLEEARQQRDVVKTLCLNDKLNQLDVAQRSARERKRSLDSAASRGDQDLTNHEFTILSVLFQRSQQLDAEAKQCIGKEVGFVGESSSSMDVEPGMPSEDTTEFPEPDVIPQIPVSSSISAR